MSKILAPGARIELSDLIAKTKSDIFYSMNCVQIGKITSFDASKNTASVQISSQAQLANGKIIDYPILEECPVFVLSGGDAFISFPINAGDSCILLFNDRDFDKWFLTGETNIPLSARAHSLSDAICLVGVRPSNKPLEVSTSKVLINAGTKELNMTAAGSKMDATTGKVTIKNNAKNLKIIIDALLDALKNMTTTNAVNGAPSAVNPLTTAKFDLIKSDLALLLSE